jgi:diphthamide biosynthesis methyltransferase
MKPSHALEILNKAQDAKMERKEIRGKAFDENFKIIILSHAGWEDEKLWAGKISEYKGQNESGPAVIIFPSKMHFMEEEAFCEAEHQSLRGESCAL